MLALILGAAGGVFAAFLFALLALTSGFYLHTLSVLLLLPAGGVLAGAASGFGVAAGTKAALAAPTRARYAMAAILGPLTYLAIYLFLWRVEAPDAAFWLWVKATVADSMRSMLVAVGRP